jgi:hypothetical protein
METKVIIRFYTGFVSGGAEALLEAANCGPDVATVDPEREDDWLLTTNVCVTLDEADPRLPVLRALLKKTKAGSLPEYLHIYTEEDLDSARLLLMKIARHPEVPGGVKYGTTYDLSGTCPACGTCAKQTSDLFVDAESLELLTGQRGGSTECGHILVDPRIEAELVRIGATGISFRDVYARWPDERTLKISFRQLCADKTLPPMSPSTTGLGREPYCELCERDNHGLSMWHPTRLVYRASDLRDADDVNMSWENVGDGLPRPELKDSLLAYPWMLVTPKVCRIFRDAGVTCFDWIPIRVEEA